MLEKTKLLSVGTPILAMFSILLIGVASASAQTETVLYSFAGSPDGAVPQSSLISDGSGNFYGTTVYGGTRDLGTVFQLSPAGYGGWNETVLHSFSGKDGAYPESSPLVFDNAGNLYGTTYYGGLSSCAYGCGVVYELSPEGKRWKQTVLYRFAGGTDGSGPVGNLITDAAGNLYGTLSQAGGVFRLTPSGNGWSEQLIYAANVPKGGLVMDATGDLLGVTDSTVFELSPNGNGGWTSSVIHTFVGGPKDGSDPQGSLVFDRRGRLYGTTYAGGERNFGTAYMLRPDKGKNKGTWTWRIIHSFHGYPDDGSGPSAGLATNGNFWGTTVNGGQNNDGTVFEITVTSDFITTFYSEYILWNFNGTDGAYPAYSPILDSAGNLYGTTPGGGSSGVGVVFELTPNP